MKCDVSCFLWVILDVEGASYHWEGGGVATEWGRCCVLASWLLLFHPTSQPRSFIVKVTWLCVSYLPCVYTYLYYSGFLLRRPGRWRDARTAACQST